MSTIHAQLQTLKTQASVCTACDLAKTRANVVFGNGSATTKLAIVAEDRPLLIIIRRFHFRVLLGICLTRSSLQTT